MIGHPTSTVRFAIYSDQSWASYFLAMMTPLLRLCLIFLQATLIACSSSYDENLALRASYFSSIAHADTEIIKTWSLKNETCYVNTEGFKVEDVFHNKTFESQVFIGVDVKTKLVVLSFRGSTDLTNVVEDLESILRYHTPCVVNGILLGNAHKGMCGYYQSVLSYDLIGRAYELMQSHNYTDVMFTGHSLGAAAASLAATHMGLLYPDINPLVYTFGEPRAGDSSFVAQFEASGAQGFRVVHYHDPVPHLCFACHKYSSDPGCPLHQASEVYYCNEDMPLGSPHVVCAGEGVGEQCSGSMPWTHLGIQDHCHYFNWNICGGCG